MKFKIPIVRIAKHLRKYMLFYLFLVIVVALLFGYKYKVFFKFQKDLVKNMIITLAVITLYPSMVQLKFELFVSSFFKKIKIIFVALVILFVINPLFSIWLANFISNREVAVGYVAANVVPASSASIAYTMIAEGSIELATLLAMISIVGAIIAAPLYISLYARELSINIPLPVLAKSIMIALITPFILGQLTRYYVIKHRAKKLYYVNSFECKKVEGSKDAIKCIEEKISIKIKPYLSVATLLSMFALVFLLIASKAGLLLKNPELAFKILGLQTVVYASIILTVFTVTKLFNLAYEDHMGIMFITLTKNESVAAAMTTIAIGITAAIPAALIPSIQPVVAMIYIGLSDKVRKILGNKVPP